MGALREAPGVTADRTPGMREAVGSGPRLHSLELQGYKSFASRTLF